MIAHTRLNDDTIEQASAHRFVESWIVVSTLIEIGEGLDDRPESRIGSSLIERSTDRPFRASIHKYSEGETRNLIARSGGIMAFYLKLPVMAFMRRSCIASETHSNKTQEQDQQILFDTKACSWRLPRQRANIGQQIVHS
jgi:hypothetical protein